MKKKSFTGHSIYFSIILEVKCLPFKKRFPVTVKGLLCVYVSHLLSTICIEFGHLRPIHKNGIEVLWGNVMNTKSPYPFF